MREAFRFLLRNRWHLCLFLPGAILVTALHEAAHAVAVRLQGGTVTAFRVLPSDGTWGFVEFSFPADSDHSSLLISIAPYLMWLGLCLGVTLCCLARIRLSPTVAGFVFIWGFVIPLADIANTAFPWVLLDGNNDFSEAWGRAGITAFLALGVAGILAFFWGNWVQRILYRENALSGVPFALLFAGAAGGILMVTCGFLL